MSNFWGAYQNTEVSTRKYNNEYDVLTANKKLAPKPKFQRKHLFKIMENYCLSLEGVPYLLDVPTCQTLLR